MSIDNAVRYARNIHLPEIGEKGQKRLSKAKVLVVGAGGLGSPMLLYLAAAGVGTIGIIDYDRVALSNLQRQILYETDDIGRPKVDSAIDSISYLNPEIKLHPYYCRLTTNNVEKIISNYDLVADGSDNFETRLTINKACFSYKKTLVAAAAMGFFGQLYTFKPYIGKQHPCYQCVYSKFPPADLTPRCSETGILGSLVGTIGSLQATEIIKELLGIGESLSGYMMYIDALSSTIRKVKINRDLKCICCGNR